MSINGTLLSTWNYLVPAQGTTNAYTLPGTIAAADILDFAKVGLTTGQDFNPSGVIIDNIAGTSAVTITIRPTGQNISCPIGKQMGLSYPAPSGHSAVITANGANISFVDYPVIPYLF